MRLFDIFQEDPEKALEERFIREKKRTGNKAIFIWTSSKSTDGTRYGSYKYVTRHQLEGRKIEIEYWDGDISLLFLDVVFDPKNPRRKL